MEPFENQPPNDTPPDTDPYADPTSWPPESSWRELRSSPWGSALVAIVGTTLVAGTLGAGLRLTALCKPKVPLLHQKTLLAF